MNLAVVSAKASQPPVAAYAVEAGFCQDRFPFSGRSKAPPAVWTLGVRPPRAVRVCSGPCRPFRDNRLAAELISLIQIGAQFEESKACVTYLPFCLPSCFCLPASAGTAAGTTFRAVQ